MRVSVTKERVEAIGLILEQEWLWGETHASVQDVLNMGGQLWNLTYIIRAGRSFVWPLLRLTNLHKAATAEKSTKRVVRLG